MSITREEKEKPAFEQWCIVELMGHKRLAGLVSDVEMFGVRQIRIDRYSSKDKCENTSFYAPSALYGLHPTTAEACWAQTNREMEYERPVMPMLPSGRLVDAEFDADGDEVES